MNESSVHAVSTEDVFSRDLATDPIFRSLLRQFSRSCISWESFLEQPIPHNTSPKHIWELLHTLSQAMGVSLAVPDLEDNWYTYRRTYDLTDIIFIVSKACSSDSHIYRAITEASKRHFLFRIRVRDTIAATRLDGLSFADKDANQLLSLDRTPQNATEQLIVNTFNATDLLPGMVDEPFSQGMFRSLQTLLLENVDIDEIETIENPPLGLTLFDWPDVVCEQYASRQMDYISDWANHITGDQYDHPAIRAIVINDCFRFYRPLGQVSNQVGRLVAHLYAIKHDLPVLGLLPSSQAKLDWFEGRIAPPAVSFDREAFVQLRKRSPFDLTSMATIAAELMLLALREVEADVTRWEQNNEELRSILKSEPSLNARQRNILGRALQNPDAEFSIRYHKTNNGIAYPTARRDFLELVDKGYLIMQKRGKAFIFIASSRLQELVDEKPDS